MTFLSGNLVWKSDINVTPLIDVLLVLLIIFMVITPLVPRGFDALVTRPPANESLKQSVDDIVLTVNTDRTVLLNHEILDLAGLPARLLQLFGRNSNRVLFIRGHADLEFRQIMRVIDIAKAAGLDRIALMTH